MKQCINCGREQKRSNCDKCRRAIWVKKNLIRDKYNNLKGNAKRREIEFTLTLEQFTTFCNENNYQKRCGRTKNKLTIDRRNPNMGVKTFKNITMKINSTEMFRRKKLRIWKTLRKRKKK